MRPSYLCSRDRGNYKESAACSITKARNSSHFHIPLIFCPLLSQPCSIRDFFLFDSFLVLVNRNLKKKCVQRTVTLPQGQQHISSAQQSKALFGEVVTWMGNQIRIPSLVIPFLFFIQCGTSLRVLYRVRNAQSSFYT